MASTKNPNQNAITMLTEQHREVKAMFDQFEDMSERAKVGKKKLADQICEQLNIHTMIEEEIFYPAVRGAGKEFEDILEEAVVEHASAKELVAQIMTMDVDDELYDAKVKVLGEQVEHHVQEEEKEMFPKVKKAGLDLQALGEQMQARMEELKETGEAMTPPQQISAEASLQQQGQQAR